MVASYSTKYDTSVGTENIYKQFGTQTLQHEWPVIFALFSDKVIKKLKHIILRYFCVTFALFSITLALHLRYFALLYRYGKKRKSNAK